MQASWRTRCKRMPSRRRFSIATPAVMALLFFILSCWALAAPKQASNSWKGYLIDLACARERMQAESDLGQRHTRKCMQMPACDRSGFGLLTDSNELITFDERGNEKVRALLQQTTQSSSLRVTVHGAISQDVLRVRKIELKKR